MTGLKQGAGHASKIALSLIELLSPDFPLVTVCDSPNYPLRKSLPELCVRNYESKRCYQID